MIYEQLRGLRVGRCHAAERRRALPTRVRGGRRAAAVAAAARVGAVTVRGLPRERAEPEVVCRVGACELVARRAISRLHLAYISPTSRLHLAYISPTSRPHLAREPANLIVCAPCQLRIPRAISHTLAPGGAQD